MVPRNAKYVLKVVRFSHREKSKGEPRLCLHTAHAIQSMCEMRTGKFVCSASIATFNHINDQVNKILRQTWAAIF